MVKRGGPVVALAGGLLALATTASSQSLPAKRNGVTPLPRDLEIQLALSALPRHLRDGATVYVLNPAKGFEVARRGTNGFHTFVARTGDDTFRGTWPFTAYRDDILYPVSFDAAGAKANMRVFFDAAALQASGMAPQRLKALIQSRYRTHYYKPPGRPGLSSMMAPILRTYINPEKNNSVETTTNPHIMHYAPNLTTADLGAAPPSPSAIHSYVEHGRWDRSPDPMIIAQGPHGFLIQHLGVAERDAIDIEYANMLDRLCKLKTLWCLKR